MNNTLKVGRIRIFEKWPVDSIEIGKHFSKISPEWWHIKFRLIDSANLNGFHITFDIIRDLSRMKSWWKTLNSLMSYLPMSPLESRTHICFYKSPHLFMWNTSASFDYWTDHYPPDAFTGWGTAAWQWLKDSNFLSKWGHRDFISSFIDPGA